MIVSSSRSEPGLWAQRGLSPAQVKAMVQLVWTMQKNLSAYQTPRTGEPVDPSHVGTLHAAAVDAGSVKGFLAIVNALPRSYVGRYTKSAGPQLDKACKETRALVDRLVRGPLQDADEDTRLYAVRWCLGWVRRLLSAEEKKKQQNRGGGNRGGGNRGRHGKGGKPWGGRR